MPDNAGFTSYAVITPTMTGIIVRKGSVIAEHGSAIYEPGQSPEWSVVKVNAESDYAFVMVRHPLVPGAQMVELVIVEGSPMWMRVENLVCYESTLKIEDSKLVGSGKAVIAAPCGCIKYDVPEGKSISIKEKFVLAGNNFLKTEIDGDVRYVFNSNTCWMSLGLQTNSMTNLHEISGGGFGLPAMLPEISEVSDHISIDYSDGSCSDVSQTF